MNALTPKKFKRTNYGDCYFYNLQIWSVDGKPVSFSGNPMEFEAVILVAEF